MQSHTHKHDSDLPETITEIMDAPIVVAEIANDDEAAATPAVAAAPTASFDDYGLPNALTKSLHHMKYTNPTPVQMQAIPAVLKGKDILGSAQTGTGKTGAFVIPILSKLMNDPHEMAIVMAPTRELAAQIQVVANQMAHGHVAIKTALLIGGESMGRQRAQLSARPRLIIGTPGRMNDHLRSNPRMYEKTTMLVLDEADRMLDMGFAPQIKEIIQTTNPKRQTLMFSATFPANIMKFAQQYLRDPIRIAIDPEKTSAAHIKHVEVKTTEGARYGELLYQLQDREGSIIVFIKTKHGADRMAKKLQDEKLSVDVIHGGLNQRQRDRAIIGFRQGKTRIMIATDVAARGLDVPHIEHVINYDLPQVPEDYVHRIGRTGRNGKEGTAVSFIMPSESAKWRAIQRILNPNAPRTGSEDHGRNRPAKNSNFRGDRGGRDNRGGRPDFREGNREGGRSENRFERRPERAQQDSGFRPQLDALVVDDAPRFERKPFGNKPYAKKSFGDKPRSFGDKPRFDKPRGEGNFRPREEGSADGNAAPRKSFGDRPRSFGDKPRFENKFGDKPRSFGDKPRFDKPRSEGNSFRPRQDGEPNGNVRPADDNAPHAERKIFGDKPRFEKKWSKPQGQRPQGNGGKPFFKKRARD